MKQGMIQRERFEKQDRGEKQEFTRTWHHRMVFFTELGGETGWLHWGGGGEGDFIVEYRTFYSQECSSQSKELVRGPPELVLHFRL